MSIVRSVEQARGCGYRKPGKRGVGIYLIGPGLAAQCCRMPLPLERCSCCGSGIKVSRGWTWIVPRQLFPGAPNGPDCGACAFAQLPAGNHGLLWVGEAFYPLPGAFIREAAQQGVSRRLSALPRGFKLGETWVFLAHRKAIWDELRQQHRPGVFQAFMATGVDLVIDPDLTEPPELAKHLAETIGDGARIVQVVRDEQTQTELFPEAT